ncbi:hypothetical protein [Salinimicrobium gaetbulicola]|uniref:Uncharacterized protein n=1 Tax=Salinimicrobium gaetbulicola TaxID=999702 RepID=A0ABW3IGU0_9FLAO
MARSTTKHFSGNEKEIAELIKENLVWKEDLSYAGEEINFLSKFLEADVFQKNILNLYEKIQIFCSQLDSFRTQNLDLSMEVHNNKYDIQGMLECEDISCEIFYHDEHLKLGMRIMEFIKNFKEFKLEVFSYTSGLLKKSSKEM